MRVEFYYSSKDPPGSQFPCDNQKVLELCKLLQDKGRKVRPQDCGEQPPSFMTYHAAVTGPPAVRRSVFGTKGALEEEFGKAVLALLIFEKEGERYPIEVYPRMDKELHRLVGIEEALQNLLNKA